MTLNVVLTLPQLEETAEEIFSRKIKDALLKDNPNAVLIDGFESSLVGIQRRNGPSVAVYNLTYFLELLEKKYDMKEPWESIEYFNQEIICNYVCENAPAFVEGPA